jgi:N-acetylglucosamine-6-sulfatase
MKRIAATFVVAAILFSSCGSSESFDGAVLRPGAGERLSSPTSVFAGPDTKVATSRGAERTDVRVAASVDRPNIVVIMTDDQTVESMRVMPKVQALLADEGTSFSNSIVTYPTCCPSRATFFTGQYAHNNGVRFNSGKTGGFVSFKEQETAFPAALQKAGYRTAHIGKFLNGYGDDFKRNTEPPAGWTHWAGLVGLSTGQYFNFTINVNGKLSKYPSAEYQTDALTDLAVEEIRVAADGDKPFFLSLAYLAPHAEFGCPLADCTAEKIREDIDNANSGVDVGSPIPAPEFKGTFADEPLPGKSNYDRTGFGETGAALRPPLDATEKSFIDFNYRSTLETLKSVDNGVETVVKAIEAAGELDNTVIIFTSDNGFFFGEHRFQFGKYMPYEESLTVPLYVRGPGVAVGQVNDTVVTNADLAPTILEMADAKPLRVMDGLSLGPLLKDPALLWDRPVAIEGLSPPITLQPEWHGIRTRRFAYFEFVSGGVNGAELYDIVTDPHQMNNLVLNPAFADVVAEFHRQSLLLQSCVGAECWSVASPPGFEGSQSDAAEKPAADET